MDFNIKVRVQFKTHKRARMGIWQAMEMLNTLVDESDPDVRRPHTVSVRSWMLIIPQTSVSQIEHLLQTAEALRRDGKPDWMQVTGLIHDLGKLWCMFGSNGQWDVVGDTFVVGCKFSDKNIYPETFAANPDAQDPLYSTENGVYQPGCGLDNVMLSWGHDEYLFSVLKDQSCLPEEALAMIRYHSFYPYVPALRLSSTSVSDMVLLDGTARTRIATSPATRTSKPWRRSAHSTRTTCTARTTSRAIP